MPPDTLPLSPTAVPPSAAIPLSDAPRAVPLLAQRLREAVRPPTRHREGGPTR
jgi:hypothetical protein